MADAGTLTGATSNRPHARQHRKNPQKQPEKTRIMTMKKRRSTIARLHRGGTTAAAGLPRGLSRNGQTIRTVSNGVVKPGILADTG
jgi:hypothetical protein